MGVSGPGGCLVRRGRVGVGSPACTEADPPPPRERLLLLRTVRILLECILIFPITLLNKLPCKFYFFRMAKYLFNIYSGKVKPSLGYVCVTFNERFVQCLAHVLGTYLAVACLTKSGSHTSLLLTNLGLVVTKVGPTNSC